MVPLFWQISRQKESGTHGRKWYTEEKGNIAFSLVLEVNCDVQQLEGMTIEIANTLVQVLEKWYAIYLEIKFPNDLVYQGKKIGGILTETKLKGKKVKHIVVGIRYQYKARTLSRGD